MKIGISMNTPNATPRNWLRAHLAGDSSASGLLGQRMYDELRAIARQQMRHERDSHTLQATAVVNEALLRLLGAEELPMEGRSAFVHLAARTMRRVLIDHARARQRRKRAGHARPVTWIDPAAASGTDPIDVLTLDDALARLARLSERQAEVVELRYFGGLTLAEAAAAMGIGRETAKEHWTMARAWLNRELSRGRS